jgi:signal transduction histidine kinase
LTVTSAVVTLMAVECGVHWSEWGDDAIVLVPWMAVTAVADLMPVPLWGSAELMISFPVLLAAAFVFPPYLAGALSFVATVDMREVRREISPLRGLLNRSNVALAVFAAGTIFHRFQGDVSVWPAVLVPVLAAVAIDVAINASLLLVGTHLLTGQPVRVLASRVYGGDQARWFLMAYTSFGLLALLLATIYDVAAAWGLIVFVVPLLLARQMFVYWKNASVAAVVVDAKNRALAEVTARIADERRDERLALAAGIHDEVLPLLYQVHLMGEVLKRDLSSGRLLDLEADLPELVDAAQVANDALREFIGELRRSSLGPGGLVDTVRLLVRQLESRSSARFDSDLHDVDAEPLSELLIYQIAREALTNAAMHSRARAIRLSLRMEDGYVRLQVDDDGVGFEPRRVDGNRHFGLALMRERAELAGGAFVVDSVLGSGTTVVVRLPAGSGEEK